MFIWLGKDEEEMKKDVVNGTKEKEKEKEKMLLPHMNATCIQLTLRRHQLRVRCRHGSNFQSQLLSFEQNGTESERLNG